MKNPTEQEVAKEFARLFPVRSRLSDHELAFLAFIHIARSHGVGYGWMRQAIGVAWKLADPLGYIDDDRIVELHSRKRNRKLVRRSHANTTQTDATARPASDSGEGGETGVCETDAQSRKET